MKKALKLAALGLLGVVVLLVLVGLFLPRQWRVERAIVIQAQPARIHPLLANLRRWQDWAAWNKEMDPEVKYEFAGPEEGAGASWSWQGPKMGRGRMVVTRAEADKGLWVDEAIESDEINAQGALTYAPEGTGTRVTWTDTGTLPPVIGGYFVGQINDMLGGHFQVGLERLKALAEKP
jgi:Polyketide cyclase / dehydrase and lipid transport